jgi:hypothetical protein
MTKPLECAGTILHIVSRKELYSIRSGASLGGVERRVMYWGGFRDIVDIVDFDALK